MKRQLTTRNDLAGESHESTSSKLAKKSVPNETAYNQVQDLEESQQEKKRSLETCEAEMSATPTTINHKKQAGDTAHVQDRDLEESQRKKKRSVETHAAETSNSSTVSSKEQQAMDSEKQRKFLDERQLKIFKTWGKNKSEFWINKLLIDAFRGHTAARDAAIEKLLEYTKDELFAMFKRRPRNFFLVNLHFDMQHTGWEGVIEKIKSFNENAVCEIFEKLEENQQATLLETYISIREKLARSCRSYHNNSCFRSFYKVILEKSNPEIFAKMTETNRHILLRSIFRDAVTTNDTSLVIAVIDKIELESFSIQEICEILSSNPSLINRIIEVEDDLDLPCPISKKFKSLTKEDLIKLLAHDDFYEAMGEKYFNTAIISQLEQFTQAEMIQILQQDPYNFHVFSQDPNLLHSVLVKLNHLNKDDKLLLLRRENFLTALAFGTGSASADSLDLVSNIMQELTTKDLFNLFANSRRDFDDINDAAKHSPHVLNTLIRSVTTFDKEQFRSLCLETNIIGCLGYNACCDFPLPDGLDAISNQLGALDIDDLVKIFKRNPDTLQLIAYAACKGHPEALNAISSKLGEFSEKDLFEIFKKSASTLSLITEAACKGYPKALNTISSKLKGICEQNNFCEIVQEQGRFTIRNIAVAALHGHADALDAISEMLGNLSTKELLVILKNDTQTLGALAHAACKGYPKALNAISSTLGEFSEKDLFEIFQNDKQTLGRLAEAACKGNPKALNAISSKLKGICEQNNFCEIVQEQGRFTIRNIAVAALHGHADALDAISEMLGNLSTKELLVILENDTHTLGALAVAAYKGYPKALNAISQKLGNFSTENISSLIDTTAVEDITATAFQGHINALRAILDTVIESSHYRRILKKSVQDIFSRKMTKSRLGVERSLYGYVDALLSTSSGDEDLDKNDATLLKTSINWYAECEKIFKSTTQTTATNYTTWAMNKKDLSSLLCKFINDEVLKRDMDPKGRLYRVEFVHGLCDYLTLQGYHHIVLDLNNICISYQSGLMGLGEYYSPGYTDSVLEIFESSIANLGNRPVFTDHGSNPEKKYEEAYTLLRSFNKNLGAWIQFKKGRSVMKAQDMLITNCVLLLRAYNNYFGPSDESVTYAQIHANMASWQTFKSISKDLGMDQNSDVTQSSSSSASLETEKCSREHPTI